MASVAIRRSAVSTPRSLIPLSAIHHVRRMRGGTQAHLMMATDGQLWVTKFKNNPFHPRILANEFFATRLALSLGLPMQPVEIIEVSDWLISHTPKLRMELGETVMPCSSGLQVGSLYAGDPETDDSIFENLPPRMALRVANRMDFALTLPFDKWVGNCDNRQAIFVKRRGNPVRYRAIFLDQGDCFNTEKWAFPDLPYMGAYNKNWVYRSVISWGSFEPVLSRIENFDLTDLWNIAVAIPQEWYQHDSAAICRLVETLYKRRGSVRDLVSRFRRSDRNPFPNWTRSGKLMR